MSAFGVPTPVFPSNPYPALAPRAEPAIPVQADNDNRVLEMWIHGRPATTTRAYLGDLRSFREFIGRKQLREVTLGDLQDYTESLEHLATRTVARKVCVLKSLFSLAWKIGYLRFNPAAVVRIPTIPSDLTDRILSVAHVARMVEEEPTRRNRILLRLFYGSGCRVSEIAGLRWKDCRPREDEDGGTITVLGKGAKTRTIRIYDPLWSELCALRNDAPEDAPVFVSRKKNPLSVRQMHTIVTGAAKRIGVKASPHFMRHSHASHSVARGCPLPLVKQTLGHSSLQTTEMYLHANPSESSGKYLTA